MKFLQRIPIYLLIIINLIIVTPKLVLGQTVTTQPPDLSHIDELTQGITVSITNLNPSKKYQLCADAELVGVTCITYTGVTSIPQFTVCGAEDKIKFNCSGNNWFHGGNTYNLFLAEGDLNKFGLPDSTDVIKNLSFYVFRHYPGIDVTANSGKVKITITGRRPGPDSNNNYAINASDSQEQGCVTANGSIDLNLTPGQHTIYVREQIGDTGIPGIVGQCSAKAFPWRDGFLYYQITLTVNSDGSISNVVITKDPENKDKASGGGSGGGSGENPCKNNVCKTALGDISTDPAGFAGKILSIAIGLAGGIALILMVIGSVRVLTSSGDQQRLAGGRDMIVAALAGLLFLIFSVLILRFIGIHILGGITGF